MQCNIYSYAALDPFLHHLGDYKRFVGRTKELKELFYRVSQENDRYTIQNLWSLFKDHNQLYINIQESTVKACGIRSNPIIYFRSTNSSVDTAKISKLLEDWKEQEISPDVLTLSLIHI